MREVIDVRRIVTGTLAENCYVVAHAAGDAVIVDPGDDFERIAAQVAERNVHVHAVLNTHAHHDHLGAATAAVEEYGAPFHLHPADHGVLRRANFYRTILHGEGISTPSIDVELADGMTLRFGALEVTVIHTPGHTPGGVCLAVEDELFSGDTILADRLGRTDLPTGDPKALEASLALVAERCQPMTRLRPGHGEPALLADLLSCLASLPGSRS